MENPIPIKLMIFDLDDTLIYSQEDKSVGGNPQKFGILLDQNHIMETRVVDGPNMVQRLMPNTIKVLQHLRNLGITLTWASMGPEWQMRRFAKAFQIDQYFDWEIGSYDRRDKGEKVELCIEHYNARLSAQFTGTTEEHLLSKRFVSREETVFVDDNMSYLARVESYLPGVKVIWAHYQNEEGLLALFQDLSEQYEIRLPLTN